MSSSISAQQKQNAQEISDLAEEYRKKRREIVDRNENMIQALKDEYQNRQQSEKKSGEAAVNNIRQKNISNEQQLKQQREAQEKYYNELQTRARQEKAKALSQEYSLTKQAQEDQAKQRTEIQRKAANEIEAINSRLAQEKAKAVGENREQLNQFSLKQREEFEQARTAHQRRLDDQRKESFTTLQKQRDENELRYEKEREQHAAELHELKQKMQDQYLKERTDGQKKTSHIESENDKRFKNEIARGTHQMEATRMEYDKNIKQIHHQGEVEARSQKEHFEKQIKTQHSEYRKKLEEKRVAQDTQLKKSDQLHLAALERREEEYKRILKGQNKEFNTAFTVNDKRNRQTLQAQNDRIMDALIRQKSGLLERYGKYEKAGEDPFYKMQEFETRVAENENYYLVRTKVPEYERDNVDVIVKDDKVIISGQRAFAEKLEKDSRQITTNSHQSFREIIPLKHPTVPKAIEKSYEDGTIAVMIPKIPI